MSDYLERRMNSRDASSPPAGAPPAVGDSEALTAGALGSLHQPAPRRELKDASLVDLASEILARLRAGQRFDGSDHLLLGEELAQALRPALDVHLNRFSARRHYDLLRPILDRVPVSTLARATVVDLGCGSVNPFTFSFLLLLLGAERAYAIDLEPVQDLEIALRGMAAAAGWLLINPGQIIYPHQLPVEEVLRNLRGFDLSLLSDGDIRGLAPDRLSHRLESVCDLSLSDGEADAVFSVSLLEHLEGLDDALESLRRITKLGGLGHHVVDFADHRIYSGDVNSPFEFLKVASTAGLLYGSNRVLCVDMCRLFERHGFDVEAVEPAHSVELTEMEHSDFVEPYRSMPREQLAMTCARIIVRRRA
jgi:SAM-dependent methyltransferase